MKKKGKLINSTQQCAMCNNFYKGNLRTHYNKKHTIGNIKGIPWKSFVKIANSQYSESIHLNHWSAAVKSASKLNNFVISSGIQKDLNTQNLPTFSTETELLSRSDILNLPTVSTKMEIPIQSDMLTLPTVPLPPDVLCDLKEKELPTIPVTVNLPTEAMLLKLTKGGFQLEFLSISRVINHMTCYKFESSHWWKIHF